MNSSHRHSARGSRVVEADNGGRGGEGTQYLDRDSGIFNTIKDLTPEQASQRHGNHPSIAAHLRRMVFHIRVAYEWMAGDHSRRDWKGSFLPQSVTAREWRELPVQLEATRGEFLRVMRALTPDELVSEGIGMGVIAHLVYHLGAIRQLLPPGTDGLEGPSEPPIGRTDDVV